MVAIARLADTDLRGLSQRTDSLGVLSIYADTDRRHDPNLQATGIDLKNRFRELQRWAAENTPDDRRAIAAALERLWPRVADITGPAPSSRSHIVFAALESDWVLEVESNMSVTNRLVLDDGPFIHPLVELLDEGRPAGVVLASADDARLLEWRVGSLQLLSHLGQPYVQAPHERAGQIGGGPQGQFHTPMREQRQAREQVQTQRLLDQLAEVATELAGDRGWERILVSGGPQWTEPVVARFPQALRTKVYSDARALNGLDDAALAAAVTEWAHEQHAERERQLPQQLANAAGSGRSALGLSEVAAALNAGQVSHLVYDPEVRYAGAVGADGALYGGAEVGPNGQPATPEPRFTERLVEQALRTGARVSPVEGAAAAELSDAAGVAALLRW